MSKVQIFGRRLMKRWPIHNIAHYTRVVVYKSEMYRSVWDAEQSDYLANWLEIGMHSSLIMHPEYARKKIYPQCRTLGDLLIAALLTLQSTSCVVFRTVLEF